MILTAHRRIGGQTHPFVITVPVHANTKLQDLILNAEDAVRPLRVTGHQLDARVSVGFEGQASLEPSLPQVFVIGEIEAGKHHELFRDSGAAMKALREVATRIATYLPANLADNGKPNGRVVRIQYGDTDEYLGRDIHVEQAISAPAG
ncbi:hypothetical protein A3A39_02965 [Candidatus Kaiserbacteria bacterium RIFCSPLOWO2_01_FULL_54_13]|uniref:Uncharacterized protein n=1 Tax=Candidatus Kaiserbacteria bacterium RIFCSPLOWO2_01_FULL_54_13 TaxID=1798512 RepID=A0A1F6F2Y7_9BACT|nr:MAG: hypothetical protein A3A39_02965 [Candidatus Kaiserbacteria bacterium RIFCSPLOWO2_01_FULL_54_13]